jgi:small-conductance mechanosensitive channel
MTSASTTPASSNGSATSKAETPEELQAQIEVQREQLAETLDALTEKLDVKTQAQHKVADLKAQARVKATELKATTRSKVAGARSTTRSKVVTVKGRGTTDTGRPRPELLGIAAAGVTALVALVLWRRR